MAELSPDLPSTVAANPFVGLAAVPRKAPCDGCAPVQFTPSDIVHRDITRWNGIEADTVEMVRREPFQYRLKASCHLLVMAERGERDDGETLVEGLPKSTRRDLSGRMSFVPSGHKFCGWHKPRVLTRVTYFYIDPRGPLLDPELRFAETEFKPRLYFHDRDLWAIASKLKAEAEHHVPGQHQYAEALTILLAHELLRLNNGAVEKSDYVRGGLAAWQKTRVTEYVEEHLAENVLLVELADVARLSQFHFSRAFKQSFGVPPLRYVTGQRIERAKTLLTSDASITEIGLAVGFGETSSFTTAFRKHTGITPSAFRRDRE
jgi:AraC family transcriptional regulator